MFWRKKQYNEQIQKGRVKKVSIKESIEGNAYTYVHAQSRGINNSLQNIYEMHAESMATLLQNPWNASMYNKSHVLPNWESFIIIQQFLLWEAYSITRHKSQTQEIWVLKKTAKTPSSLGNNLPQYSAW